MQRGWGSTPGQGARCHLLQLNILCARSKTQCNQINKINRIQRRKYFLLRRQRKIFPGHQTIVIKTGKFLRRKSQVWFFRQSKRYLLCGFLLTPLDVGWPGVSYVFRNQGTFLSNVDLVNLSTNSPPYFADLALIFPKEKIWLVSSSSPLTPHLCWVISVLFSLSCVQLMCVAGCSGTGLRSTPLWPQEPKWLPLTACGYWPGQYRYNGPSYVTGYFFCLPSTGFIWKLPLDQVSANFFCKRAERKYFRFCGPSSSLL